MKQRLTLDVVNRVQADEFVTALANVFENSPWIAEAAERARPFSSLSELRRDALIAVIDRALPQRRLALIRAHPETQRAVGLLIIKAATNADGRTDRALIEGRPVPIGTDELRFHLQAYFARCDVASSEPPFLDVVPVRFGVSEPEAHLHIPLLASPWSYATYRGS
jgi:5-hydroxyisourate hydrolase-like protein (transthyretin family)